ncbi:MAG: Trk system potassium transporter TrkA [Ruminococcaceae bacterium]|nr:Trk system potassium transporter TrkA [Oscillospiraceae bacterium]
MNIVIAGIGKLGTMLTQKLAAEGHNITIIDSDLRVTAELIEEYDIMAVEGNCASIQTLREAGIEDTDLLIATTRSDELNLLSCMTAHYMNKSIHTIARLRTPEYMESTYALRKPLALSLTVNPERHAAREISRLLKYPGFIKREKFANGLIEIVGIRVTEDSPLKDKPIHKLPQIAHCQVIVCTALRHGKAITPDGEFVFEENDIIYVTASAENLNTLLKNLGLIKRKIKNIIIAGGGRVCYYLTALLEKENFNVKIIERDAARCEELAEHFENVSIIHGDASSMHVLEREGIETCDALISMTGMDEQNAVISIYGSSLNIPKVITKLGRAEHVQIYDNLPVGSLVSPKELSCNTIVRYVRAMQNQVGSAVTVHSIAEGQAEAIEFIVDENTKHCNEPLKDITLKKEVLIASITHGRMIEFPNGDSTFHQGDRIVVVKSGEKPIHQLNDIFAG